MVRQQLEEFLSRIVAALWLMAVRNPRTTAAGVVGALVMVGARLGLELTPAQQGNLAAALIVLIGILAGDGYNRRKRT
ncbi:MAG TPA: hypothetical protein VGV59_14120 [Pyrinomonadaceae bacterium]|nr:hypothetical protein [Pyrinomonadaceae bacterium]